MPKPKHHYRTYQIEDLQVRQDDDGATHVEGYAALFNTLSKPLGSLGGMRERIEPGAFRRAVEQDDVRLLINHDPSLLLARNKAGTLALKEDERGLFYSAKLPDTTYAKDLVASMERGDINQNSFGFQVDENEFVKEDGEDVHVVKAVRLFDVSVVTFPAYDQTTAKLRSVAAALARNEVTKEDIEALRQLLQRVEEAAGVNTNDGEAQADGAGAPAAGQDAADQAVMAAIRRRELELYELEL